MYLLLKNLKLRKAIPMHVNNERFSKYSVAEVYILIFLDYIDSEISTVTVVQIIIHGFDSRKPKAHARRDMTMSHLK